MPDDDPSALQGLLHYLYHFTLAPWRPSASCPWISLVRLYALADEYDIAPLHTLFAEQLDYACEPVPFVEDFVAVLRVVDACTADNTLWDILLPKVRANIKLVLQRESFRELVMELPCLTLPLLSMLDHDESVKALKRKQENLSK